MKRTINLDLDGVFAAFDVLVKGWLGRPIGWHEAVDITNAEWDWLSINHPRMFAELPVCEGASEFGAWIKEYRDGVDGFDIVFLTAIPRSTTFKYAAQDKISWANKNFPFPVCIGPYSKDKMKLARIGDILIDDRIDNLKGWSEMGGQGIYHPTNGGFAAFEHTKTALIDCTSHTLPGIWKAGKKEPLVAK